ncbi:unnamed protein product [Candida verbasci]|uniref:Vacuolar protein sorting-associated protein 75 n=1 Tax=Candida verbasci TaxID=1227364 RepID=A0A9W4XEM2_9ASCO|nr:unnamed protein product [Candida verbasci]
MAEFDSTQLQKSLGDLSKWEKDMSQVEKELEIDRIKQTQPLYEKRRNIIKTIPKFWYIIFAENDDLSDYINPEDLKYLECIDDIFINYPNLEDKENFRDFEITINFNNSELNENQQVIKKFYYRKNENGEEIMVSDPVEITWPKELESINPIKIKERNTGKTMSKDDKKNYRQGMKSFFAYFQWTGEKHGKEFRNGEELTNLIVDDLYLNALKYYAIALSNENDDDDEEEDSSEGEELDLSDNDDEIDKKRKLDDIDDDTSSKKAK